MGVVELLAFFYAYSLLVLRIKAVNTEYLTISEKMPHFEKAHELIERAGKVYLRPGTRVIERLESGIHFSNVWFRYPGIEESVLKGVTFTIERLRTTALVGASGVGKTTVADLVLRLHDPTEGQLLVNGDDLREFRAEDWHRLVSIVEQEPYLFHDSVLNNIRYGKLDATEAEVREAARLAYADRFIEAQPRAYDTVVGERGMTLSAGQRQRIALARAIIRNPEVLILDEATSALDSESERLIQEAIDELKSRCTLVIIAHRLSTIVNADRIVILEGGRVVEEGSHHELLERKGLYQRYYSLQMELEPARRGEGG